MYYASYTDTLNNFVPDEICIFIYLSDYSSNKKPLQTFYKLKQLNCGNLLGFKFTFKVKLQLDKERTTSLTAQSGICNHKLPMLLVTDACICRYLWAFILYTNISSTHKAGRYFPMTPIKKTYQACQTPGRIVLK